MMSEIYRLIFEHGSTGILLIGGNGYITEMNPRAEEITGYTIKDLRNMTFRDLIHPDYAEYNAKLRNQLFEGNLNSNYTEQVIIRKGGIPLHVAFETSTVRDEKGNIANIILQITDIEAKVRADESRHESLQRYESLFYYHPDAVYVLDTEGNFIESNEGLAKLAETTRQDILNGAFHRFIHPDDMEAVIMHFKRAMQGEIRQYQIKGMTTLGHLRIVRITNLPVYNKDGKITGVFGIARDVTERVNAELERDQLFAAMSERLKEMQCLFQISALMNKCEQIEDILHEAVRLLPPAFTYPELATAAIQYGETRYMEKHFQRTELELMAVAHTHTGTELQVCVCYIKEPETKKADIYAKEEKQMLHTVAEMLALQVSRIEAGHSLAESEAKQRRLTHERELLLQSVEEGIYGIDSKGNCTFINGVGLRLLGYTSEQCMGKNMHQLIHHSKGDGKRYPENECPIFKTTNRREAHQIEDEYFWRKDGSCFPVSYTANPILDSGKHIGAVVSFIDISDKLASRQRLEASERKYKSLFDASPQPKWVFDIKTLEIIDANEAAANQFNCNIDELKSMRISDLRPSEELPRLYQLQKSLMDREGTFKMGIFTFHKCDGTPFMADVAWHRLLYDGRPAMMVSANDVTDREKAIDALIDREQKLEIAQRIARLGYWQLNLFENTFNWSQEAANILGRPAIRGTVINEILDMVHPDDQSAYKFFIDQSIQNEDERVLDHRFCMPDGSVKWVQSRARRMGSARSQRIEGAIQDIHNQKSTEIALAERTRFLSALRSIENSFLHAGSFDNAVQQSYQITGETLNASRVYYFENRRDAQGNLQMFITHEWVNEGVSEEIANPLLQGLDYSIFEGAEDDLKKGLHLWIEVTSLPEGELKQLLSEQEIISLYLVPILHGKEFIGFVGIDECVRNVAWSESQIAFIGTLSTNLTEAILRRRNDMALLDAHTEKTQIIESISDGFFAVDRNRKVVFWNRTMEVLFGVNQNAIMGKCFWDVFSPDSLPVMHSLCADVFETGKTKQVEQFVPDSEKWLSISVFPSSQGMTIFVRDVTDAHSYVEEIKQHNERFKMITEATRDAIYDWDIVHDKLYWGEGYQRQFGYPSQIVEGVASAWTAFLHKSDRPSVEESLNNTLSDTEALIWTCEYKYKRSDGSWADVLDMGRIMRDKDGKAVRMVGAMSDVSERKEREKALRDSETRYANLFHLSPVPTFVFDLKTLRYLDVNKAACQRYGYSYEEFCSMTLYDLRPSGGNYESLEDALSQLRKSGRLTYQGEFVHRTRSGELLQVESYANIIDYKGVKAGLSLAHDISERQRHLLAIEEQNEKLKEISWIQSHLVRGPLVKIMGLVGLIRDHVEDETERKEMCGYLLQAADELDDIIHDISQKSSLIKDL